MVSPCSVRLASSPAWRLAVPAAAAYMCCMRGHRAILSPSVALPSCRRRRRVQDHSSITHSLTHSDRGRGRGSVHPSTAAAAASSCVCVCVELWHCCSAWHLTALTDEQRALQLHACCACERHEIATCVRFAEGGVDPHWLRITITPTLVTENFGLVVRLPPPPGPSRCSNTNITST